MLPGLVVRSLPEGLEDLGAGSEAATAMLGTDGRFTLFNVPAGSDARCPAQHRGAAVPIASGYRAGAAASRPRLWISWRRIRVRPFGTVMGDLLHAIGARKLGIFCANEGDRGR